MIIKIKEMKGYLNKPRIDYVFYHLGFFIELDKMLKNKILFVKRGVDISNYTNKIIFLQTNEDLNISNCLVNNEVIHLFPHPKIREDYTVINKNVVFNHDILKASFYLLSGYQEYICEKKDKHSRFPFTESVQFNLGFATKPMVNYYFKIITEGLKKFGELTNYKIESKSPLIETCFCLSHDVDRINFYSVANIKLFAKSLVGKNKSGYSKKQLPSLLIQNILNNFFRFKEDPYWNFKWLRKIEKDLGINSTFYFLLDGLKNKDAFFKMSDPKIKELITFLEYEQCEIGVHGTTNSYNNQDELNRCIKLINKVVQNKAIGIRQHYLKFDHPITFQIQQKVGLKYDSTLGFAEHEGFRNSFAHPFKPFDFEKQQMMEIWEVPLLIMDRTLFDYRNLSFQEAQKTIENLFNEVDNFNGVFSLLWHNSYFDETLKPGITSFYQNTLEEIMHHNPITLTGRNLIEVFNNSVNIN